MHEHLTYLASSSAKPFARMRGTRYSKFTRRMVQAILDSWFHPGHVTKRQLDTAIRRIVREDAAILEALGRGTKEEPPR